MNLSRSEFLRSLLTTAAVFIIHPLPLSASTSNRGKWIMVQDLSLATFTTHIHSTFTVQVNLDKRVELQLTKVVDHSDEYSQKSKIRMESFTLLFRGPAKEILQQNLYTLSHDSIGTFELLMAPFGQDDEGVYYQIPFSRLLENPYSDLAQ